MNKKILSIPVHTDREGDSYGVVIKQVLREHHVADKISSESYMHGRYVYLSVYSGDLQRLMTALRDAGAKYIMSDRGLQNPILHTFSKYKYNPYKPMGKTRRLRKEKKVRAK